MAIRIKCDPGDAPIEVSAVELEDLIKSGRVQASSLLHDKILTDGEWRTADNLYLFHRASPKTHPYGPYLLAQEARQERQRSQREDAQVAYEAYRMGTLIEDSFGLDPIDRLLGRAQAMAATRLIVLPSFCPERIVTITFSQQGIEVLLSESPTAVWNLVPHHEGRTNPDGSLREIPRTPFFRERVVHRTTSAPLAVALEVLGDISQFLSAGSTPQAPRDWGVLDGIGFRHRIASSDLTSDVTWSNPSREADAGPIRVLNQYRELLGRMGAAEFIPDYREEDPPPRTDFSKLKR